MFSLNDVGFLGSISTYDTDALAYIRAVEIADTQELEPAVRDAINAFVVGCKADGIWSAIKASCILAGARTLTGALVPLVGTAPTNVGFVSGDYNRETGLVGNGSSKYLNSKRASSADPQNSHHLSMYQTEFSDGIAGGLQGSYNGNDNSFDRLITAPISSVQRILANTRIGSTSVITHTANAGLVGVSRSAASLVNVRRNQTNVSDDWASAIPNSDDIYVFARNPGLNGTPPSFAAGRIAFYSIGESLDLALLDTRVTTLINAIAAAIP